MVKTIFGVFGLATIIIIFLLVVCACIVNNWQDK